MRAAYYMRRTITTTINQSRSKIIPMMSGWKHDPISLEIDADSSFSDPTFGVKDDDSSDLNDEQFELVKERFYLLRNKYGTLWKSMLQDKENNNSNTATPSSSPEKPQLEMVEGGCETSCECATTQNFLPVTLLKPPNYQSPSATGELECAFKQVVDEDDQRNVCNRSQDDNTTFADTNDELMSTRSLNNNSGLSSSNILNEPIEEKRRPSDTDEQQPTFEDGTFLAERRFRAGSTTPGNPTLSHSADFNPQNKKWSIATSGASSVEDSFDDEDSDDSSAESTVLQWDSWSDPDNAGKNSMQTKSDPATEIGAVQFQSHALDLTEHQKSTMSLGGESNTMIDGRSPRESTDESRASMDSEGAGDSLDDQSTESESEAEWDGDLQETEPDMETLIQQIEAIEILDSSDEELSDVSITKSNRTAQNRDFKRNREHLSEKMFHDFDRMFCDGRLGECTTVVWSKNLQKTAGLTRMKKERPSGKRSAQIDLATKVLDNETRLRDTLVHEMCHAAAFVIDDVTKPPHGACFKKWADRAMRAIPGVKVTTTHDYVIKYSHFWACSDCSLIYKRHSRSIDTTKHRCGRCKGDLFVSTEDGKPKKARATSEYQKFIKQNSKKVRASLKKRNKNVAQAEVLQECARLWRVQKEANTKAT